LLAVFALSLTSLAAVAEPAQVIGNVLVYKELDRFAGWPANAGMWTWGDEEIVVGFTLGWHEEREGHTINREKGSEKRFARSLDGGKTWTLDPTETFDDPGQDAAVELTEGLEFTHPDFALMFAMTNSKTGFSRFFYSTDRCKTWKGPCRLPALGQSGVMARTDYIIEGPKSISAFMTASIDGVREGRPFYARSQDGALTWEFVSYITPEPPAGGYSIMPATVRVSKDELVTIIRRRERVVNGEEAWWIDAWKSYDNGKTWHIKHNPLAANEGNPASLNQLNDGRLVATYGHRGAPYGLRAKISLDNGETWGEEIVLRDDGGLWDIGYPRTIVRPDGRLVSAYYYNLPDAKERFIAATIWDAGTTEGKE
jgi:hypothetical protein